MKNVIKSLVTVLAVAVVVVGAYAQKPKAKTMACPYCKMTMTTKKSKAMPVAVKIKGTTFYCCTSCHPAPKKK